MPDPAPKISVLVPVFNAELYVRDAIKSILAQTFEDFELLILDDGSTDGSGVVLRSLAASDGRIRLIQRGNAGLVASLTEMLALARGEYLARMDADDIALKDRFRLQVAHLDKNPSVVCLGGGLELIDSDGCRLVDAPALTGNGRVQTAAVQGRTPICHPAAMFRADAARSVGGYRAESYPAEDLDFFLRLGEVGDLDNVPETVLRYRVHAHSISVRRRDAQIAAMRAACEASWRRRGISAEFHGWPAAHEMACEPETRGPIEVVIRNPTARALLLATRPERGRVGGGGLTPAGVVVERRPTYTLDASSDAVRRGCSASATSDGRDR